MSRGFISHSGNHAPKGPFVLNKDSPQAQGLVGWWPGIRTEDGALVDLSGHGNHANSVTGMSQVSTEFGAKALNFDGTSTTATIPRHSSIEPAKITLSGWLYNDDSIGNVDNQFIFDKPNTSHADPYYTYNVMVEDGRSGGTDSKITAYFVTGTFDGSDAVSITTPLFDNKWGHFTVTFDGSNKSIYVNGGEGGTNTVTQAGSLTYYDNDLIIGQFSNLPTRFFGGRLFDLRIYNRAMTAREAYDVWSPATRWDLYQELGKVLYFFPPVATAVIGAYSNFGVNDRKHQKPARWF